MRSNSGYGVIANKCRPEYGRYNTHPAFADRVGCKVVYEMMGFDGQLRSSVLESNSLCGVAFWRLWSSSFYRKDNAFGTSKTRLTYRLKI